MLVSLVKSQSRGTQQQRTKREKGHKQKAQASERQPGDESNYQSEMVWARIKSALVDTMNIRDGDFSLANWINSIFRETRENWVKKV